MGLVAEVFFFGGNLRPIKFTLYMTSELNDWRSSVHSSGFVNSPPHLTLFVLVSLASRLKRMGWMDHGWML